MTASIEKWTSASRILSSRLNVSCFCWLEPAALLAEVHPWAVQAQAERVLTPVAGLSRARTIIEAICLPSILTGPFLFTLKLLYAAVRKFNAI